MVGSWPLSEVVLRRLAFLLDAWFRLLQWVAASAILVVRIVFSSCLIVASL